MVIWPGRRILLFPLTDICSCCKLYTAIFCCIATPFCITCLKYFESIRKLCSFRNFRVNIYERYESYEAWLTNVRHQITNPAVWKKPCEVLISYFKRGVTCVQCGRHCCDHLFSWPLHGDTPEDIFRPTPAQWPPACVQPVYPAFHKNCLQHCPGSRSPRWPWHNLEETETPKLLRDSVPWSHFV